MEQVQDLVGGALQRVVREAPNQVDGVVEGVKDWVGDVDWERILEAGSVLRMNVTRLAARVPGRVEGLVEGLASMELVARLSQQLEEGDLTTLEEALGDVLEAGLFGLTFLLPPLFILMFFIKDKVIGGTLALVEQGVLTREEATLSYRNTCSRMWRAYGRTVHAQEFHGLDNIPRQGGALLIYYHGHIPVDYCALVGETWLTRGRAISSVVDTSLMDIPGLDTVRTHLNMFPGTRESCTELLRSGNLLGIAPGGAYECFFGDTSYPILWGNRQGFAAVAIAAGVPIIPVFTENIREASLTLSSRMNSGKGLWEYIYKNITRGRTSPMYGLFPVKLRTHLGAPIHPAPGMEPAAMVAATQAAMQALIDQHQQLPGSVSRAMLERVGEAVREGPQR